MSKKYFSVPNCGNYIYDSLTNKIITIPSDNVIDDFFTYEKEIIEGLNGIEWGIEKEAFIKAYHTQLRTIVLQITQDCNLQCVYCAYSGEFSHMFPHAKDKMSVDTARKSIDFFMNHSCMDDLLTIIFYGGEPLLEFDIVMEIVNYANSFNRKIHYGISTNGTLLSKNVIEWLIENPNVYLTVTINGNKHDEYRIGKNGHGTLQIILDKMEYIKQKYPAVWKNQVRVITNIYSYEEVDLLREFFLQTVEKIPVAITNICLNHASEKLCSHFSRNADQEKKKKAELIDTYINQKDPFLEKIFETGLDKVSNRGLCTPDTPGYIDSCAPLIWRLFIRSNGEISLCEKVSDHLGLGNVVTGYDESKILKLYYGLRDFCYRNCRECWAQRLCMFCYQDIIDENGEMIDRFPEERCVKNKMEALEYLKMYVRMVCS